MKKLIMEGPKRSKIVDVPISEITEPDMILVKNRYCGVCMSEHYDWSTAEKGRSFGHEPMGRVVAVGSAVKR